jgi:hypothetical protein
MWWIHHEDKMTGETLGFGFDNLDLGPEPVGVQDSS